MKYGLPPDILLLRRKIILTHQQSGSCRPEKVRSYMFVLKNSLDFVVSVHGTYAPELRCIRAFVDVTVFEAHICGTL